MGVFLLEYALLLMGKPQQAFMLNGAGVLFGISLTFLLALSSPAPSALRPGERLPLSRRSLIVVEAMVNPVSGFVCISSLRSVKRMNR